jgi:thiol-disulfide isomerase/thioredoxin
MRKAAENSVRDPARNLENRRVRDCARNSLRYGAPMRSAIFLLALLVSTLGAGAAELLPIEKEVAEIAKSGKVTVVHFWAPWCANCRTELKEGWGNFITRNRDANVVFITTWPGDDDDGRSILERYGVGAQKNFRLFMHPNTSRNDRDKVSSFLGLPVTWVPATWIFRDGKLRYALNYGELRFPVLQQFVDDATPAK